MHAAFASCPRGLRALSTPGELLTSCRMEHNPRWAFSLTPTCFTNHVLPVSPFAKAQVNNGVSGSEETNTGILNLHALGVVHLPTGSRGIGWSTKGRRVPGAEAPAAMDGRMAALFLQNITGVLGCL